MDYIWLIVDVVFLWYFVNSIAHEAGWFSARHFRWANPDTSFGRNNVWLIMFESAFAMLWIWILFNDVSNMMVFV